MADRVVQRWQQVADAQQPDRASDPTASGGRATQSTTFGRPLDAGIRSNMSHQIGFDFSSVRIHTDDVATHLNQGMKSRAFTNGRDIYFNRGEYDTGSVAGRFLLAHELTHVAQQAQTPLAAQRGLIQRTSIGQVLDEFFSPMSSETLWLMDENDNYTRIVRRWQPVIEAVNEAKSNLAADCRAWQADHTTSPSWKPGRTDPPVVDPNAFRIWKASPPGTDPETCRNAFIIYVTSKVTPGVPTIQTFELHTCAIGSFGVYATVDSIDCPAKTARMRFWMYNAMDRGSFGRYASHPAFALSGMERQYMWWNWSETYSWGAAKGAPTPSGGSSRW